MKPVHTARRGPRNAPLPRVNFKTAGKTGLFAQAGFPAVKTTFHRWPSFAQPTTVECSMDERSIPERMVIERRRQAMRGQEAKN